MGDGGASALSRLKPVATEGLDIVALGGELGGSIVTAGKLFTGPTDSGRPLAMDGYSDPDAWPLLGGFWIADCSTRRLGEYGV